MLINGEEHNDLCVGIDLGTTNSVLSIVNQKPNGDLVSKVIDLPRADNAFSTAQGRSFQTARRSTLPSCVYYRQDDNYSTLVGDFAKSQHALRPHLVAKSIKSQMGEPFVTGLSPDIPDQTPAKVASRILKHMLDQAKRINRSEIKDVVITVPANFDAAMCKATLEAANLAGIQIRNKDGSERPILLSEPNAVIYDLVNEINNGEINANIIDLSTPKYVLVFDLGGGTLDITLHSLKWRDASKTTLKVDEIATNRYTLLGGDDFDEALARVMFERYLNQLRQQNPDLVNRALKEKDSIMPLLLAYAEDLKIRISNKKDQFSSAEDDLWGDDEEDDAEIVGGNLGTGYAYDDRFTVEEVEEILAPLLGRQLSYEDYKSLASLKDTRNIIYPILDVLAKAAQKLGVSQVKVDEVILNGGMSKLYLIKDRLQQFFNLEPIIALDPDLSVARGAAIYHYYLHQNEAALKEDMRLLGNELDSIPKQPTSSPVKREAPAAPAPIRRSAPLHTPAMAIEFGQSILNDSLYLGLRNGAQPLELIPTGQELPYQAPLKKGLRLSAHVNKFYIPIQRRNLDGTYRTIVKGEVQLHQSYKESMYVAFNVTMSRNKVLTMNAWISSDPENQYTTEECTAELVIGQETDQASTNVRLAPPSGIMLNPHNEIHNLLQLCTQFNKCLRCGNSTKQVAAKLRSVQEGIHSCSNKADFAAPILRELSTASPEAQLRLLVTARRIMPSWTPEQKLRLGRLCFDLLKMEISGFGSSGGARTNVLSQAIYNLGYAGCGTPEQMAELVKISNPKYLQALIYAFGMSRTNLDWLFHKLLDDVAKLGDCRPNTLQSTAYSLGYALRCDQDQLAHFSQREALVKRLCAAIENYYIPVGTLVPCIIALGWTCDQRFGNNPLPQALLNRVIDLMHSLDRYSDEIRNSTEKSSSLVIKMLEGTSLTFDDQKYLLELTASFEKMNA